MSAWAPVSRSAMGVVPLVLVFEGGVFEGGVFEGGVVAGGVVERVCVRAEWWGNEPEKANDLPSGRSRHAQQELGALLNEYYERVERGERGGRRHGRHHSPFRHVSGKS